MKKFVSLLLALLLAAAAPLTVFAEEPMKPFEGLVTEVFEGGFLMEDKEMGLLQVNVDENTVPDGILSFQPMEAGMYVIVDHNGMMTRSIPPQVYGMRVGCYTLNGVAGEIAEDGVLLTDDPIFGEVFVQMTPTMANVFPGVPMLVYYDGVMTMSLPGKVNARYVVVPELTGVVSEKDGAGFTLTDEDGNTYRILTSDSLLVGQLAMNEDEEILPGAEEGVVDEGTEVAVDETVSEVATDESNEAIEAEASAEESANADGEAADAKESAATDESTTDDAAADEAASETTDEATEEPTTDEFSTDPNLLQDVTIPTGEDAGDAAAAIIAWGDGDTVTVYHQGPIDAQAGSELVALGMLIHR